MADVFDNVKCYEVLEGVAELCVFILFIIVHFISTFTVVLNEVQIERDVKYCLMLIRHQVWFSWRIFVWFEKCLYLQIYVEFTLCVCMCVYACVCVCVKADVDISFAYVLVYIFFNSCE
jgi:hypothetical protein